MFFSTSGCGAHFAEIAGDGPRQPAYKIFSIEHSFLTMY